MLIGMGGRLFWFRGFAFGRAGRPVSPDAGERKCPKDDLDHRFTFPEPGEKASNGRRQNLI